MKERRDYSQEALDALAQLVLSKRNTPTPVVQKTQLQEMGVPVQTEDSDLDWLIKRESGGKTTARNPRSSAFGLGQLLSANRKSYAAKLGISNPDTTDYAEQLKMMQTYIKDRYGSATAARRFHEKRGWY